MPRLDFKNFSDLSFIQRVDKPRFMAPLLEPGRAFFALAGVNLGSLKNTDEDDQRLHQVFTEQGLDMPPDLLELLYVIDDLADESGHDRIIAEAERQGTSLDAIIAEELSPGEFAIAVHLKHPKLIRVCHEKTVYRKIKNYEEYQGKGKVDITLKQARSSVPALEKEMSPWFEKKGRSRACEIYVYEEQGEIKFQITHGRPVMTDGTWTKKLQRSRVAYRPQKHDSVVYEMKTRVLRANSQTEGEKNLYRSSIGKLLFGDAEYFPLADLYTLTPLHKAKPTLVTVPGLRGARLTEALIVTDDGSNFSQLSRATNLLVEAEKRGSPNFQQGYLLRAAFMLTYESGKRPRKLELRPTSVAIYDRDRDGEITQAFLRKNGFLKRDEA